MEIDRRQVLLGTVCSALTGAVGARGTGHGITEQSVNISLLRRPARAPAFAERPGLDDPKLGLS